MRGSAGGVLTPADRCIEQMMLRGHDIVIRAGRVDGIAVGTLIRVGELLVAASRKSSVQLATHRSTRDSSTKA